MNLPVAPITDLKIHQNDLIAATSGRAFWILDDLSLIRQYQKDLKSPTLFQPENAILVNGRSELDKTDESFSGTTSTEGVNPANGIVLYYYLPEAPKGTLTLEIKDLAGNLVRTYSSKKDSLYRKWDGGPSADPTLSAKKGLNRIVWDMRYPTLPGVPDAYFECSYKGHKAVPGKESFILKQLTLSQAEELAAMITSIATGK